jgi:hypothetical protein
MQPDWRRSAAASVAIRRASHRTFVAQEVAKWWSFFDPQHIRHEAQLTAPGAVTLPSVLQSSG